jgi:hypothetical protein
VTALFFVVAAALYLAAWIAWGGYDGFGAALLCLLGGVLIVMGVQSLWA